MFAQPTESTRQAQEQTLRAPLSGRIGIRRYPGLKPWAVLLNHFMVSAEQPIKAICLPTDHAVEVIDPDRRISQYHVASRAGPLSFAFSLENIQQREHRG